MLGTEFAWKSLTSWGLNCIILQIQIVESENSICGEWIFCGVTSQSPISELGVWYWIYQCDIKYFSCHVSRGLFATVQSIWKLRGADNGDEEIARILEIKDSRNTKGWFQSWHSIVLYAILYILLKSWTGCQINVFIHWLNAAQMCSNDSFNLYRMLKSREIYRRSLPHSRSINGNYFSIYHEL